jgi:hypothetical protein
MQPSPTIWLVQAGMVELVVSELELAGAIDRARVDHDG